MPMYSFIECSKNYRKTTSSLWNYYRDEPNNSSADNFNADPITNSASFKYQRSIIGKTANNDNNDNNTKEDVESVVPSKYLSNFWRNLEMPLISCEINLISTWSENCVVTDVIIYAAVPAQEESPTRPTINAPTKATFKIIDTKLYVLVVTLSIQDDNKLLEQLKAGLKELKEL